MCGRQGLARSGSVMCRELRLGVAWQIRQVLVWRCGVGYGMAVEAGLGYVRPGTVLWGRYG